MAVRIEGRDRIGVAVEAVEAERLRVPSWFGEAVLLGQYWLESGLVGYLEEEVRVERGRMCRVPRFMSSIPRFVSCDLNG